MHGTIIQARAGKLVPAIEPVLIGGFNIGS
jgi:hypothetical protein